MSKIYGFVVIFFFDICFAQDYIVPKGQSITIPAKRSSAVHVHSGKVISVTDLGSQLKVKGKKIGKTHISIGEKSFAVAVISPEQNSFFEPLKMQLSLMKGLNLEVEPENFVITGELLRLNDWQKISDLKIPPELIRFEAEIHEIIIAEVEKYIRRKLEDANLPTSSLTLQPKISIAIPKSSKSLVAEFKQAIGHLGIPIVLSDSDVELAPMVRSKIVVASIHRKHLKKLGIAWPKSYSAKLLPKLSTDTPAELSLDFVEDNGWGRILASPTLLCRSGKEASLHSGGEYPIRIANYRQKDIFWKKHGVMLKLKPVADYSGKMSISIETEVSRLVGQSKEDLPTVETNKMSSHFDVVGTQTIALSGLIMNDTSSSRSGVPGFVNVPILGRLFGSHEASETQSELVIFVTPKVISPEENFNEDQLPASWNDDHD